MQGITLVIGHLLPFFTKNNEIFMFEEKIQ